MNFKNFVEVEISTGYDASATAVVLTSGEVAALPNITEGFFNLVWYNATDYASPHLDPSREIVRVTNVVGDTLTIIRPSAGNTYLDEGVENTAKVHNIAGKQYKFILAVTKSVADHFDLKATQFSGICAKTPITNADITIDTTNRTLTITPPLGYFEYFTDRNGIVKKYRVNGPITFPAWTDTSGTWFFYFNNSGVAVTTQTPWTGAMFNEIATVYRIVWNASLSGSARAVSEYIEYHLNTIPAETHRWEHTNSGAIWMSGFVKADNALPTGTPNADGRNTVMALSGGTISDENLPYTIINSAVVAPWNQDLGNTTPASLNATNSALFQIFTQNASAEISFLPATRFPFAWDVATNRPQTISSTGVRTLVNDNRWFVYFVYSSQNPRPGEPLKIVSAPTEYTSLVNAQAVTWTDIQNTYPIFANDFELRPLYKIIFYNDNALGGAFPVECKYSVIREIQDVRKAQVTTTVSSTGSIPASSVTVALVSGFASTNAQAFLEETSSNLVRYSGTFTDDDTSQTFTNALVNSNSIIEIYAQSIPVGGWTVSSGAGEFTITSTKAESTDIPFIYYIKNN